MEESAELKDAMLLEDAVLYLQEKRCRCESSNNWNRIVQRKAAKRFAAS